MDQEEETPEIEKLIPLMRSCRKEEAEPIGGSLKGEIPKWLQGTLIRVGSGLLEVGPDRYNHIFDGLAFLHRFSIRDGQVTYQNKFLRSDAYKKNMAANRIVVSEFGTRAQAPDPCKTIFQRLSSYFWPEDFTDNDLVNIIRFTDEFYACSETNFIWRINPENLDSLQKVCLTDYVSVRSATAHAHEDRDGTVYNVGFGGGSSSGYNVMKFPPKGADSGDNPFSRASIVCRIPFSRSLNPSYFHSFGMTDNYFIFLEQPLSMSLPRLMLSLFSWKSYASTLQWLPECKSRFFIVRRKDGLILSQQYLANALMIFHHVNAYEEDNQLVVDMCCYEDGRVIESLYVQALRDHVDDPETLLKPYFLAKAKRYVIPLTIDNKTCETDNLVKVEGCKAKAFQQNDGTVILEPEILAEDDSWYTELPRINYELCNGKKYNYFYAVGRKEPERDMKLVKVNTRTGTTLSWGEEATNPSEPIFIAKPDAKDEDDGVIVASLLSKRDDKRVSLLVLDAKTMTEMGRTEFVTASSVPGDFHGLFIKS